ncbi:MAG: hypothetical protein JO219_07955 [Candidatus Eremiobacteraeota bacterium]|nr:hypothetical protein [Candidatus Eremiobacteraeota bacterium]
MSTLLARISLTVALIAACMMSPASATSEVAGALRGPIVWHVILCQFQDSALVAKQYGSTPQPKEAPSYYQTLFFASGVHGLQDYINSQSHGIASVSGDVHGWYTEPQTWQSAKHKNCTPTCRRRHESDCLAAAKNPPTGTNPVTHKPYGTQPPAYTPPSGDRVYVITSPGIDIVGFENQAAVGQDWFPVPRKNGTFWVRGPTALPEIAHEFGHGIGLAHSFSNDLTWPGAGGAPGEYGNQWDLMSAAHIFVDPTGVYGGGSPFLTVHHLDEKGWIAMNRIIDVGSDGVSPRTITLAALTHPNANGYIMARVLFDEKDPFHYYTVEYRVADSWDGNLTDHGKYPNKMIMISEIRKESAFDPGSGHGSYVAQLQRELGKYAGTDNGPPLQSLSAHGVTIDVVSTAADSAVVKISTKFKQPATWQEYGPLGCATGYVWRAADQSDYVCVLPATRDQAQADNAAAGSRHKTGSRDCKKGYVWRGAFPGDDVCVTKATRDRAQTDNAAAPSHIYKQNI